MKTSRKVRVLVVDGEPLTLLGLESSISRMKGYRVCAAVATAAEARAQFTRTQPELLLVEYPLRGGDALALLGDFRRAHPAGRIVILCALGDAATREQLFKAGAHGFLHREDAAAELAGAFATVLGGELFLSHHALQATLAGYRGKGAAQQAGELAGLSAREFEIYTAIAQGLGPKAIAERLHISVKTVETHQVALKRKLAQPTCADLQAHARKWLAAEARAGHGEAGPGQA